LSVEIFFVILLSHRRVNLEIKLILFLALTKISNFFIFTSFIVIFFCSG